ncbi:MAG: adenylyltransferase/cytidyltransferase family protein [Elusimicrobia bacterium]|nr:adenylyltransferase/cytidyltransferase family protein [Elusimicrobiota bacterium]
MDSMKIQELDSLALRVADWKRQGKRVVQCHGVFDLLHVGHIRHLNEAKSFGDYLIVTLTPDHLVNKGPHRPAFPQHLRAEVLAALDVVDGVAINRWPSAVESIGLFKPDVYAKGPDYRKAADDVTGGILREEEAVRAVGGEIRFTDDVTFSSSNLANLHLDLLPPEVKAFLGDFRKKHTKEDITRHIESLNKLRVAVVGETILDEYVYCDAMGKSSKEPTLAVLRRSQELYAGGALAIANHLAQFCAEVQVITYLGERDTQEEFVRRSLNPRVQLTAIKKPGAPTIVKRRYVESYLLSKMFEVYDMDDEALTSPAEDALCEAMAASFSNVDAVLVADYGHGLMTPKAVALACQKAPFLTVNTQINAANIGFHAISRYPKADHVCIQESELRLEYRSRRGPVKAMVTDLERRLSCQRMTVTRGRAGILVHDQRGDFHESPAFAVKVLDRIGAGDAVLALTSLCAVAGVPPDVSAFLGNLAGAQAVTIIGNKASIDKTVLLKAAEAMLK